MKKLFRAKREISFSLLPLLLSAFCLFSSCDCADCQKKVVPEEKAFFNVTPPDLSFTKIQPVVLKQSFNVSSSMDWILVDKPEGFTFDVIAGGPGLTKVTVTVTDYDNDDEVTVKVVASNGAVKIVTLKVTYPNTWDEDGDPEVRGVTFQVPARPYVGAFWRKNQTGERIIRIENMYATTANRGLWRAYVKWLDQRWGTDRGVVLSKDMVGTQSLADRNISFSTIIPDAAVSNAEDYQIAGYQFMVEGEVTAQNPDIIFRIGLKKTYTPTTQYPARYALVHIEYGNPVKYYKVYLRQGEDADYVMRSGDPNGSGAAVAENRAFARKFSPYNLTDPDKGAPTTIITTGNPNNGLPVRGGSFVEFPSQVGHYFTFNYNRQAFAPHVAANTNFPGNGANFWDPTLHETCPIGWRRPNEGDYTIFNTEGKVEGSEFRQSLWLDPPVGNQEGNLKNSVFGNYADGFFDRRQIVPTNLPSSNVGVSFTTFNGALRGRLFFNPTTNASLFFPAGGNGAGNPSVPGLGNVAYNGFYHTTSAISASTVWCMVGMQTSAGQNYEFMYINSRQLMSIRCVKEVLPD